jgi:hypothetical protein
MSQNILVKPTPTAAAAPQTLFSLNIRNVTDLFPGFAPGDFAVIHGSSSINTLTSMLCIQAQMPVQSGGLNSNVLFIDGGNTFRLYQISRLAQLERLNPGKVLDRIFLSRAFTAYQMTTLIMEQLKDAIEKYNTKLVIISDIAGLFLDKDIPEEESRSVFSQVMASLQRFVHQHQIILIATMLPHEKSSLNDYLKSVTCGRANVVLALRQTTYDREIELEKHPRFMLGSAELPSDNLTLNDFFGNEGSNYFKF